MRPFHFLEALIVLGVFAGASQAGESASSTDDISSTPKAMTSGLARGTQTSVPCCTGTEAAACWQTPCGLPSKLAVKVAKLGPQRTSCWSLGAERTTSGSSSPTNNTSEPSTMMDPTQSSSSDGSEASTSTTQPGSMETNSAAVSDSSFGDAWASSLSTALSAYRNTTANGTTQTPATSPPTTSTLHTSAFIPHSSSSTADAPTSISPTSSSTSLFPTSASSTTSCLVLNRTDRCTGFVTVTTTSSGQPLVIVYKSVIAGPRDTQTITPTESTKSPTTTWLLQSESTTSLEVESISDAISTSENTSRTTSSTSPHDGQRYHPPHKPNQSTTPKFNASSTEGVTLFSTITRISTTTTTVVEGSDSSTTSANTTTKAQDSFSYISTLEDGSSTADASSESSTTHSFTEPLNTPTLSSFPAPASPSTIPTWATSPSPSLSATSATTSSSVPASTVPPHLPQLRAQKFCRSSTSSTANSAPSTGSNAATNTAPASDRPLRRFEEAEPLDGGAEQVGGDTLAIDDNYRYVMVLALIAVTAVVVAVVAAGL